MAMIAPTITIVTIAATTVSAIAFPSLRLAMPKPDKTGTAECTSCAMSSPARSAGSSPSLRTAYNARTAASSEILSKLARLSEGDNPC
jgi:hypothetical protein